MGRRAWFILGFIFLFVLVLRLLLVFETDVVNYDAYFVLRNVESIKSSGLPLFVDELSFSGRVNVFSPLYYYVLAFFSLFLPSIFVLKVIPSLFASSLVFVVFLFSFHVSRSESSALISAFAAGLVPVFFVNSLNNASIYSLVFPLFFLSLYYFLKTIGDSKFLWKFLVVLGLLSLTHASSLILVFSLLVYVFLIKIQGFKKSVKEPELLLFSLFLVLWVNLTIYKRAFMLHGSSVIYQNIPVQLIFDSFKEVSFVEGLYWIGVVPLLFGAVSVYGSVFSFRKKSVSVLIALCLTLFLLLWFKLINIFVGLSFLGVALSILASFSIDKFLNNLLYLKFKFAYAFGVFLIVFLIFASFIPALSSGYHKALVVPSIGDRSAFEWVANNTDESSVVLVLPEEGSAMSYFAARRNIIDENFLLISNIDVRYKEARFIFSDRFLIPALTKLNYYSVDYILVSEFNKLNNNISSLFYADDNCVKRVYVGGGAEVFSVNCVVSLG